MHNCKRTREDLFEMAVSKTPRDRNGSLQAELERCEACREEYASLRNALRSADQAMQAALPAEDFWPAYHARLRQRLERDTSRSHPAGQPLRASLWVRLRKFVTASITVPVPLAAGVFVLLILSALFTIFSRNALRAAPVASPPSVITKTVEVPVIREKPVTVYVERNRRNARYAPRRKETERNALTTLARRERESNPPASLAGFKPANEVKLTIIKGSYPR
jgi:anti-sigma factor RsiW